MLIECLWICSLNLHCNVISVLQIQSRIESQGDREWFADFVQRAATIPDAAAVTKTDSSGTTWSLFWTAFQLGVKGLVDTVCDCIGNEFVIMSLKDLYSECSASTCFNAKIWH